MGATCVTPIIICNDSTPTACREIKIILKYPVRLIMVANMTYTNGVSFLENHASQDERRIAVIMKKYFKALKTRNAKLLVSLFREDARIHSQSAGGKIVSRKEYAKYLNDRLPLLSHVRLFDILIRVAGDDTARVFGRYSYSINQGPTHLWLRSWKLEKKSGNWMIVESYYHTRDWQNPYTSRSHAHNSKNDNE